MITVAPSPSSPKDNTAKNNDTLTLDVQGMKCAGCVKAVERQISQYPGVVCATVNLITAVALVEYQKGEVEPENLAQKLTLGGFPSEVRTSVDEQNWQKIREKQQQTEQRLQTYQLISAVILLIFSTIGHLHHFVGMGYLHPLTNIWFHWALATLALMIPGREIILNGWQGLWHRQPNMNSLIGLGTVSAYLASCVALVFPDLGWECFFDEPVMLLGFIFLGRVLESRARNKASEALEALMSLRPPWARIIGKDKNNQDEGLKIPSAQVKPQEWVRVLEGEQFPVDGTIILGDTSVDESMLTGESMAVFKGKGDGVCAGTINLGGMVVVETTESGSKTVLSQIIAMVEEAQTRKAPVQKLADTVSGYFAYGIMTIALMTFCFWYGWGTKNWSYLLGDLDTSALIMSLKLAIDVLVIACPCALGLATPTAILVGTGVGAEQGLLIKGGDVLEQAQNLDIIVFDKTGTLTEGRFEVTDIVNVGNHEFSHGELLQIASSLEIASNHPVAQALVREANNQGLSFLDTDNVENYPSGGIRGDVHGTKNFYCGNESWLEGEGIYLDVAVKRQVVNLQNGGKTVIYLAQGNTPLGFFALADEIRPFARQTVAQIQGMGSDVILLSGDQVNVVRAIASKLNINTYYGGVNPQEKGQLIKELKQKFPDKTIAMVGDGINDAPAMTEADFAIAMPQGSEIAIKTASVVLTRNKLSDIITAIKLSQKTLQKIKQNLFWALSYNVITIPIAAGILLPSYHILLNPATAGGFMALSSIVVVTNSLQLKKWTVDNK
ncbi:copper-translocating P-type ATPase [Cyanobacterium stanieri LEGE 03274]|uniref:Copper-translocating P-type ATPase n=1 Tax=Cyanobacterium stanieri LEGE 03274 TaxID=1828756 RepID=A0ABR9V072_9CHRO|nr:heavy metal translocating P-type ATPase [Cyanobacterium stanieri]MBE9221275.1 copper-translocating P-type ATPase [Cyanobacterium stanieri LEGE 03274]